MAHKGYSKVLDSILVKPAGPDCNLKCKYCFYLEKEALFQETKQHRMSLETAEELIKQCMEQSGKSISIGWQGGEPTLMGVDFFRSVMQLEEKYARGKVVGNGLQTNGTNINEEWAEFLGQNNWLVGLSLDGPEHIHDHYRFSQNDKPTWAIVERAAKLLLDKNVAVNAMCCVTSYSANFATELYHYYKGLGLEYMQFIPIVETDKLDPSKAADFSVTAEQYGKFLIELFDLWVADIKDGVQTTSVRHFDSIFHAYVGLQAPECTMRTECGTYLCIEHNGNAYSCDFFVEPQWKLGNIHQNKMIEMLNSPKQKKFGLLKADTPRKCKNCKWFKFCYGGCTKDRVKDPNDNMMPRFCKSYMMFEHHAHPILSQLASDWKEGQRELQKDLKKGSRPGHTYNAFEDFLSENNLLPQ